MPSQISDRLRAVNEQLQVYADLNSAM